MVVSDKSLGYICGVLDGDGYIDKFGVNPRLCVSTTNPFFAKKFAEALRVNNLNAHINERIRHNSWQIKDKLYKYTSHFYNARATSTPEIMNRLETTKKEIYSGSSSYSLAWLIGFYDSEGYHQTTQKHHTISMSNCDHSKLRLAQAILMRIGIRSNIYGKEGLRCLCIQNDHGVNRFQKLVGHKSIVDLNEKTKGRRKPKP